MLCGCWDCFRRCRLLRNSTGLMLAAVLGSPAAALCLPSLSRPTSPASPRVLLWFRFLGRLLGRLGCSVTAATDCVCIPLAGHALCSERGVETGRMSSTAAGRRAASEHKLLRAGRCGRRHVRDQ